MARLSERMAQMERLGPCELRVAERRQATAAPRVLDAHPCKLRVEVVAAIHEPGPGLHARADLLCVLEVSRSHRCGQAVEAVVHQRDRLGVVPDLHDADRGSKGFLAHDAHRVIDVDQSLWRHVGQAALGLCKMARVE